MRNRNFLVKLIEIIILIVGLNISNSYTQNWTENTVDMLIPSHSDVNGKGLYSNCYGNNNWSKLYEGSNFPNGN